MRTQRQHQPKAGNLNHLRIIGGIWRSRRLSFPDALGLRPTGDRIRETLFNWLAPNLPGARCLDAFAGSGSLGFEALSRGAREAVFLETNPATLKSLLDNKALLGADGASVIQADALNWLEQAHCPAFDIIFLDPPFADNLQQRCLTQIASSALLHPNTLIYVECPTDIALALPRNLSVNKEKRAGNVRYLLLGAA